MNGYLVKVRHIGKKRCHRTFITYASYFGEASNNASWCIRDDEEIVSITLIEK